MKTCPICKARCFDDMERCYGCMHRFDGGTPDGDAPQDSDVGFQQVSEDAAPSPKAAVEERPPAEPRRRDSQLRRDAPRIFGAVPDDSAGDDSAETGLAAGEDPVSIIERDQAVPLGEGDLQTALGRIASASIGSGYKLVISIEPA